MIKKNVIKQCCGCGACVNICPKQCIKMEENGEGFLYPIVDKENCIKCNLCEKVCPIIKKYDKEDISKMPLSYAVINQNDEIRQKSSSGGVFSLLAEYILKMNGVVYGAVLSDDKKKVYHTFVKNIDDLEKMRCSKYVQSNVNTIFSSVKKHLLNMKKVLFTGTPCQIEGLKKFLGKDYDNLYCVDFICHGVPSPKVWRRYVDFMEEQNKSSIDEVNFRNKNFGWKRFAMLIKFSNGNQYVKTLDDDMYLKVFLSDVCLRKSCYNCNFKKINRMSDITMADFWGIGSILANMDDNKGTSFVIVHSNKGHEMLKKIKQDVIYKEVSIDAGLKNNPAMIKSAKKNIYRRKFFKDVDKLSFDELERKYSKQINLKKKFILFLKKIGVYEQFKSLVKKFH